MEDWRHENKDLDLRSLFRPLDEEQQQQCMMDIESCLRESLVRLLAKMRNGEEGYGNALATDWKNIEETKVKEAWNACAAQNVGYYAIAEQLKTMGIQCSLRADNPYVFPGILQIPPDNKPANFGRLISFVVDELLFNGFKYAKQVDPSTPPTLCIKYEEIEEIPNKGEARSGCLSVSNTIRSELHEAGREGRGRGLGLMDRIAYVINGEGERGTIQYSLNESLLSAKFYIPLLKIS